MLKRDNYCQLNLRLNFPLAESQKNVEEGVSLKKNP